MPPPSPQGPYGVPLQYQSPPPPVKSHLAQSILITLFCCQPLGIAAIVFSAIAMSKSQSGDYYGALDASKKANAFGWWGFGVGLFVIIIWFLLAVIGEAAKR